MKRAGCLIFIIALILMQTSVLFALPEGEQVEAGNAIFVRPDQYTLNIQANDKTVINFNSFNIAQNETVNFIQPSASSSLLSRVTGGESSQIFGVLKANGMLFLTNTQGIYFGPSAQVQANSFVASTLDISTNNFLQQKYIFEHNSESAYNQILNQGKISANNIALIASAVDNQGIIIARSGRVFFISGDRATVSFDAKNMIQVEVDRETSGKVYDKDGAEVKDALANSGIVEGAQVVMDAKVASDIFKNAVNQQGIIQATGLVEEGGVIRIKANNNLQVSGVLKAEEKPSSQSIQISSVGSVSVNAEFNSIGNTTISALKDISVKADIKTDSGNLELLADADLDGAGSFNQAAGTLIVTSNTSGAVDEAGEFVGNITVQSSGEGVLANINSSAGLILKQAGAPAVFDQSLNSHITTKGALKISSGVVLNTNNALYEVGRDWINLGNFNPQFSKVSLVSEIEALVIGSNIFYDFSITEPGKIVKFDSENTQAILGTLTFKGDYGKLLTVTSINPLKQWSINPQGQTDIQYSLICNLNNIRGPPLEALHSSSLGNNSNLHLNPLWTGEGVSIHWSDPNNWDTGTVPTEFDTVVFDGITGTNPNSYSIIDSLFGGSISGLILNGYNGTISLGRDIKIDGNLTLASGNFAAGSYTINISGNWSNLGGNYLAGSSTIVLGDSSKHSIITGDNTFYNFICNEANKEIYFESGKTFVFKGKLEIIGAPDEGAEVRYIKVAALEAGQMWYLDVQNNYILERVQISDCRALNLVDIPIGIDAGGNENLIIDPVWDGGGYTNNWSEALNWDGNLVPQAQDPVTFNSTSSKDCIIDVLGTWAGGVMIITADYAGTITLNATAITIGNFYQAAGTFQVNSAATITVNGDFNVTGGTFTCGLSTTTFAGAGNQALNNTQPFYNLTINKPSGVVILGSDLDVDNNLTLTAGGIDVSISNYNMTISGNWVDSTACSFAARNGTVTFDGTGAQTITSYLSFYDFIINKVYGTATLGVALDVNGSLTLASGTFSCSSYDITVSGDWIDTGDASFTEGTRSVTFDGTADQVINSNEAFYSIVINKTSGEATISADTSLGGSLTITSGTLNLDVSLTVTGSLTLTSGILNLGADLTVNSSITLVSGTFDVSENNYTVTAGASWTDTANVFNSRSGTVNFKGTGTLTSSVPFYNLTFSVGGTNTLGADLDVNGLLTFTAGVLDVSDSNYTVRVAGGWVDTGGTFTKRSGVVILDGPGVLSTNDSFNNLTIDTSGTITLGQALTVTGNITLASGTLDVSESNYGITLSGNWINTAGTLVYRAGLLTVNDATQTTTFSGSTVFYSLTCATAGKALVFTVYSTQTIAGVLTLTGTAANLITLRSSVSGSTYTITDSGTESITLIDIQDCTAT
ncbi:MAG: filamentous hemagglutinin N-terminal domain-containing protein, partial [Candidatus Omnitrophica bacterium]|nr:filamentous hemagglutinin N-terminal domain-containing protein [Candidatus Omnitrophota bacterium]